MVGAGADTVSRLHALVGQFGPAGVAEGLGIDEEMLYGMMSGKREMERGMEERFALLCGSLGDAVDWSVGGVGAIAVMDVVGGGVAGGEEVEVAEGVYHDPVAGAVEDFTALLEVSPVGVPAPGITWTEAQARKLENLWAARDLAFMSQVALGLDEMEVLYAMGLVNQIELALIMLFRQSVPDRSRRWDEFRRQKEIYIRVVRRNRIERDLKRERSGFRGLLNSLRGQKPLSSRDLYGKLFLYVDDMVGLMEQEKPGRDVLEGVRDYMEGGPMMRRRI